MLPRWRRPCATRSTTGSRPSRVCRRSPIRSRPATSNICRSIRSNAPRRCRGASAGPTARPMSITSRSFANRAAPRCWTDPLMYRVASDEFIGPCDPIKAADTAWGIDLEAEVAVVVTDVPQGATPAQTAPLIRLFMLVNDISLRNLVPGELAKGFGFLQSKGQTAFSPVAVTPDELGQAFDGKKVHLPLLSQINGKPFGRPNAGVDMTFDFPTLIAHAVKTRPLMGGAIIGSGTVSNRDADGGPGKPVTDGGVGYSCLAEIRTVETILHGAPKTPYLNFGDRVRIEMNDAKGISIFGAIDHEVVRA